jgi:hypothetical protein
VRRPYRPVCLPVLAAVLLATLLLLGAAGHAPAQQGPNQSVAISKLIPPGQLVIAGRRMLCGDTPTMIRQFDGVSVSSNVIVLNMDQIRQFPRMVQWLIYYHECGHINLGPSETEADCYAIQRAKREGWLTRKGLDQICATFNIVGHGPVHPDPVKRCTDLRQCYAGGHPAP